MYAAGSWSAALSGVSPIRWAAFETCECPMKIILYADVLSMIYIVKIILPFWNAWSIRFLSGLNKLPVFISPIRLSSHERQNSAVCPFQCVYQLELVIQNYTRQFRTPFRVDCDFFLPLFVSCKIIHSLISLFLFQIYSFNDWAIWGQPFLRNYRLSVAWNNHLNYACVISFPSQFWRWWQTELLSVWLTCRNKGKCRCCLVDNFTSKLSAGAKSWSLMGLRLGEKKELKVWQMNWF